MNETLESVTRLSRDIRNAAATLSDDEARFLVDAYYQMQKDRIRANAQFRALGESGEPNVVLSWLGEQRGTLEDQVKGALDKYSAAHPIGAWMRGICGIGPVIAAGLLAHIDIEKAPTVGHIWAFAGLDPTKVWEKGKKRPWNASLKVLLAFNLGESFVKVQNNENDIYGKVFRDRKKLEQARNEAGEYAEQAAAALAKKKFGADTDARQWYTGEWVWSMKLAAASTIPEVHAVVAEALTLDGKSEQVALLKSKLAVRPMLSPAHIHARARRYSVKLFVSALHEIWYFWKFGTLPPLPYPIAVLGHAHLIGVPGGEVFEGYLDACRKAGRVYGNEGRK